MVLIVIMLMIMVLVLIVLAVVALALRVVEVVSTVATATTAPSVPVAAPVAPSTRSRAIALVAPVASATRPRTIAWAMIRVIREATAAAAGSTPAEPTRPWAVAAGPSGLERTSSPSLRRFLGLRLGLWLGLSDLEIDLRRRRCQHVVIVRVTPVHGHDADSAINLREQASEQKM